MINLLPWREQLVFKNNCYYGLYLILIFIFIMGASFICKAYLLNLQHSLIKNNNHLVQKINLLTAGQNLKKTEESYKILQQKINIIKSTDSQQWLFFREFNLLKQKSPDLIQFNQLDWNQKIFRLQGETTHSEKIGELIKILEKSLLFTAVDLNNLAQNDDVSPSHFIIQCQHHWKGDDL